MPIIKYKEFLCSLLTPLHAAQTLEDHQFEDPESQKLFLPCLTPVWHRDHLSPVKAAIQYSEKIHDTDEFSPDFEGKDDDSFSLLQNPTKTPIISKDFLRVLPHCPIMHWASQMCNNPKLCFCPCSTSSQP
jgi:hypothetical protein